MPYKIKKVKGGEKVVTKSGPHKGRVHSKRPLTHDEALAQLRAMYANMKGKE